MKVLTCLTPSAVWPIPIPRFSRRVKLITREWDRSDEPATGQSMRVPAAMGAIGRIDVYKPVPHPLLDAVSDVATRERPLLRPLDLPEYVQQRAPVPRRLARATRRPCRAIRVAPLPVILVVQACLALRL